MTHSGMCVQLKMVAMSAAPVPYPERDIQTGREEVLEALDILGDHGGAAVGVRESDRGKCPTSLPRMGSWPSAHL